MLNELNERIEIVERKLKKLEKNSHPPQEFICCRKCGCEINKAKR